MIYRRYELSLSLNGNEVVHIARNSSGIVVFRESSEDRIKKAIDNFLEEKQRQEEQAAKEKELKAKAKAQKQGFFTSKETESEEESSDATDQTEEPAPVSTLTPPQQKVVRGPDGKFISRSALQDQDQDQKKSSFWDRLK